MISLFLALVLGTQVHAADSSGLQISGSADLLGSVSATSSAFQVREGEFMLAAPVDHLFTAVLSAAAHPEGGETVFELHEAHLTSSGLIPRTRARIGQFFLPVGRLNQFHRHEWVFTQTPLTQENFFDSEAARDAGIDVAYLLPLPFFVEVQGGVTSGYAFGHSHTAGSQPLVPTHFLRTTFFSDLPSKGGAQLGLNYLGRVSSAGERLALIGADLTAKWREGKTLKYLVQSEAWHRTLSGTREFGFYVYPQYGCECGLSGGFRMDYLTNLTLRDTGTSNWTESYGPVISYMPSEFSTLRLQYAYERAILGGGTTISHLLTLQAVFQLGAHPAHDF